MKYIIKLIFVFSMVLFFGCTSNFDEINTKPDGFLRDELSAKYFLTGPQVNLYAPNRYPYWRAQLIHADRYSGQVCFGHNKSWWSDELGYKYSSGYTDAAWGWLAGAVGGIDNFIKLTKKGGGLENEKMYAVGIILKGLYYQMFTDIWGMVPYSQASDPEIALPKLDSQKEIYKGVIAELDEAMSIIGDSEKTGSQINDLADNDVYYKGDLQKWKKLANTLKLRMAMRAFNAPDDDFASKAIQEALSAPLLEKKEDNCMLVKDEKIDQWASACYGDIWGNFGDAAGWSISKYLIDILRDNNDPRLSKYAKPAKGGTVEITEPEKNADKHPKRLNFLLNTLDEAGATYTKTVEGKTTKITLPENQFYIGQPVRTNSDTHSYMIFDFFSTPEDEIIRSKNKGKIRAELILSTAEAYFLKAEAAVRGIGTGDAQKLYEEGIKQAMLLWDVSETDADTYIANESIAKLTGTQDEKIGKIAMQRWICAYTDGFEAWAIVRDYAYTKFTKLSEGVSDIDLYGVGTINGKYPTRMRYGNSIVNTNGQNVKDAISKQGADEQSTVLWWAKQK